MEEPLVGPLVPSDLEHCVVGDRGVPGEMGFGEMGSWVVAVWP